MELFKIENYERSHGLGAFFSFRHLDSNDCRNIRGALIRLLSLSNDISLEELVKVVRDRSFLVGGFNAEDGDFSINQILISLCFNKTDKFYLNWYRFDDMDEMNAVDVINNIDELWYPSSDDIDLIDADMKWMLSIDHEGSVRALRLKD